MLDTSDVDWYDLHVQTEQRKWDAINAHFMRQDGVTPYEIVIETSDADMTAAYRACTRAAITTISFLWKNATSLYVHPSDVRLAVEALNAAGFATDEDPCRECRCFDDDDSDECRCDCHVAGGEVQYEAYNW